MGTINPNDEPKDQKAAIGPSVTHPEVDKPKQPEPKPEPKGKKGKDA